jgi:hypothetical protein
VKNRWVDLECNKEYEMTTRRKDEERRCCALDLDLRWRTKLQRLKNEEGRQEEGDKGHTRMILGERGKRGSGQLPDNKALPMGAPGRARSPRILTPMIAYRCV